MNYFYLDKYGVLYGVIDVETAEQFGNGGKYIKNDYLIHTGYPSIEHENGEFEHIRVYVENGKVKEAKIGQRVYNLERDIALNNIVSELLKK